MEKIPLFPLNTVLFPRGRIPLQLFEPRYLDMVRRCLREGSGFGVVLIREGSEVALPGMRLSLHRVGTYSLVKDWSQMPNGLLSITAEGVRTFDLLASWREDDDLCMAEVVYRYHDAVDCPPVEVTEDFRDHVQLLQRLMRHPAIEALKLEVDFDNLREIAWRLGELLPIEDEDKQDLLEMPDPFVRLERIDHHISALKQQ